MAVSGRSAARRAWAHFGRVRRSSEVLCRKLGQCFCVYWAQRRVWKETVEPISRLAGPFKLDPKTLSDGLGDIPSRPSLMILREYSAGIVPSAAANFVNSFIAL